jgi:hypothetical protein
METAAPAVPARRRETFAPLTGIAAVLLFIAAFIAHDAIGDTAAILVEERDQPIAPQTAVTHWFMGDGLFLAAFSGAAVLLGATLFVVLRSGALPPWFGWVTLVLGVLLLVPWVGWAGFTFAFPLWIILAGLLLWQATERAGPG